MGVTLSNGMRAEIVPDRWARDSFELVVDGTPQSHVDLRDPTRLFFEYVRRMGHVIDVLRAPGAPLTAVHLGAGALTIPRYIEATRPGSRQQVVELERALVDLVRRELPWDERAAIRIRYGDARAMLARLPQGLRGASDVVVVDVFAGARTPPHVSSVEFYREAAELLAPDGVLLVNVADGPALHYARAQAATIAAAVGSTIALAEVSVAKGRRFGNFVFAAAPGGVPRDWVRRLHAAGPHPASVIDERELAEFARAATVTTDGTATGSPAPTRGVFRVSG